MENSDLIRVLDRITINEDCFFFLLERNSRQQIYVQEEHINVGVVLGHPFHVLIE